MVDSSAINEALREDQGAIYHKSALQVNSYEYAQKYRGEGQDHGLSEDEYNNSLINKCTEEGISVIAVTDHNFVNNIDPIREKAACENIAVFPGFEICSKENVDVLCLFSPDTEVETLNRYLGGLGISNTEHSSSNSDKTFTEILRKVQCEWEGVCIAAHITNNNGLLKTLESEARMNAWKSENLLAAQIPWTVDDLDFKYKQIIKNTNPDYQRENSPEEDLGLAVINSKDVAEPSDLEKHNTSSFIKMSSPSIEALRQAFLDPRSRVRLPSEGEPEDHIEITALSWEGGFMDGLRVHMNSNLNAIIGGRGTGKSALIESLRFVLDLEPVGDDAKQTHNSMKKKVIQSGTKVSCLINSPYPTPKKYVVERTHPNPPVVKNIDGETLDILPSDVLPNAELYGQHEISELTADRTNLTRLLDRFTPDKKKLKKRRDEIQLKLQKNRRRILEVDEEIEKVEDNLSDLSALQEKLKRFEELGLDEKLKEKNLIIKEENLLENALNEISSVEEVISGVKSCKLKIEDFLPEKIEGTEGESYLDRLKEILQEFNAELGELRKNLKSQYEKTKTDLNKLKRKWIEDRKKTVEKETDEILQEIQEDVGDVDTEQFIELKEEIEELKPLESKLKTVKQELDELKKNRKSLVSDWENVNREIYQTLQNGADKVNKELSGQVRVEVNYQGDRQPMEELLRDQPGGRLKSTIDSIMEKDDFSVLDFVERCKHGPERLAEEYGTINQAESICDEGKELFMKMQELILHHTTTLKLNLGSEDNTHFEELENLSKGQKATAALLLLLLESEHPLIIDQPEDDLDNQFITEGIVPRIREEKRRRQFIFATHNANIPVLGDSELIITLSARGEADKGKAEVKTRGSIDVDQLRSDVETILEGGKTAFEKRRKKYGF